MAKVIPPVLSAEDLVQKLAGAPTTRIDTGAEISRKGKPEAGAIKRIVLSRLVTAGHPHHKLNGESYSHAWGAGGFYFAVSAIVGEYCWWSTFSLSQLERCREQQLTILAVFNPTMPGEDLTRLHVYGWDPAVILENLRHHRGVIMHAQLVRAMNVATDNTTEIAGEIRRLLAPMRDSVAPAENQTEALHTQATEILRSRRFTGMESKVASKLKEVLKAILVRIRPTKNGGFHLFADKGDLTLDILPARTPRFAEIALNELEMQIIQQARQASAVPVIEPGTTASRPPTQRAA
jgi:hypothetical protein